MAEIQPFICVGVPRCEHRVHPDKHTARMMRYQVTTTSFPFQLVGHLFDFNIGTSQKNAIVMIEINVDGGSRMNDSGVVDG